METQGLHLLENVKLDEVSLVDVPANQFASISFIKRASTMTDKKNPVIAGLGKLFSPFRKSLEGDAAVEFDKNLREFGEVLTKSDDMTEDQLSFLESLDGEESKKEFMEKTSAERDSMMGKSQEGASDMSDKSGASGADVAKKDGETVTLTKADINAAVDAAVTKALKPVQDELAVAKADNAKMSETLAKREAEANLTKMVDRLEKANVPEAAARAADLMKIDDADTRESLFKSFCADAERISKAGLFSEIGGSGSVSKDGSAYSELKALATELRKLDPSLTSSQAMAKVMKNPENSELKKRHYVEQRSRSN